MNNVKLSATDRKYFAELLDRSIPNPDSEAFDEFLEELRLMNPDVYSDLISKLEYSGEPLPVEKEARLASRRSTVQRAIDKVRNRRTHDGKTVSDKRKLIIGGLAGVGALFVWMTIGSMQGPYNPAGAAAQAQAQETAENATTEDTPPDDGFGVRAQGAQFAADLNIPQAQVVQSSPARNTDLPPAPNASSSPAPQPPAATRTAQANEAPLPDDTVSTDLPPRNPADLPPQPTSVTAAPTSTPASSSPYTPPTAYPTSGGTASATPEVLPTSLSFEQTSQVAEMPQTLSSNTTPAAVNALADVQLSAATAGEETETQINQSLSWEGEAATATEASEAAPALGWGDEATAPAAPSTLRSSEPATATTTLPPVPQVGTNPTASPARSQPARPQPIILANALPTGTEIEAELITAVAATDQQGMPVLAKTTGKWCQRQTCPEITWIGEAAYDGADRVNITFSQAVVGQNQQQVVGTAFDQDRLPGLVAHVGDGAPLAVQDLLRGAVGGASDYLNAVNTRTTTTVQDGVVVQEQAEPDLGNFLLGRSADLFALPSDQTSVIRYASLDEGKRLTVIFGISL